MRRLRPQRRLFPLLLAGLLLATSGAFAASSATAAVVFGVYTQGIAGDTGPVMDRFTSEVGVAPQIVLYYRDWNPSWSTALLDPRITAPILARGAVPMITWEPFRSDDAAVAQPAYAPAAIAAGRYDAYIRRAAAEAAAFKRPFFLRFAHEMNGSWAPWERVAGNTPTDYVAMWRHVVSLFRAAGASNVRWVWSANVVGGGVAPFEPYYPGDAWVDDVALDGYNWGVVKQSRWRPFAGVFGESYDALSALTRKPLLITETSSAELGGSKAAWIDGIATALAQRLPRVRALIWFDRDQETSWSVASSPGALQAFRRLVRTPLLAGRASTLLDPAATVARAGEGRTVQPRRAGHRRPRRHAARRHPRARRHAHPTRASARRMARS